MLSLLRRAFCLLLAVTLVRADQWSNPPSDLDDLATQWSVGLHVQLTWELGQTVSPITIRLRHWRARDVFLATLADSIPNPNSHGSFNWTIGEQDGVDANAIAVDKSFVLDMVDPSGNIGTGGGWINNTLTSKGFVINPNPTSTSSSSSSSSPPSFSSPPASSSSSPSEPIPISTTSASASPSNGSTAAANASSGLDSATKVGLGVGLGLGIPLLIILAVGCTWWIIRRRKRAGDGIAAGAGYGEMQPAFFDKQVSAPVSVQFRPSEYSSPPSELHGGGRQYEPAEMSSHGK